jgi:hypothetical protein
MKKIIPFFEVEGIKYEIKKTRWLVAEYDKLNKESVISAEDRANTLKASNLVADAQRFAEKAEEYWDIFCENPNPENKANYLMFKELSDAAVEKYNDFVSQNDSLNNATKRSIDILEKVAIKGLAEQHFGFNESIAKQTWEKFVESQENHNVVGEWLIAMSECLFTNDEEENDSFLSLKRKADMEKANNRKSALRKKR